jgi:hypothetical protein
MSYDPTEYDPQDHDPLLRDDRSLAISLAGLADVLDGGLFDTRTGEALGEPDTETVAEVAHRLRRVAAFLR